VVVEIMAVIAPAVIPAVAVAAVTRRMVRHAVGSRAQIRLAETRRRWTDRTYAAAGVRHAMGDELGATGELACVGSAHSEGWTTGWGPRGESSRAVEAAGEPRRSATNEIAGSTVE
jgi:hypothetical protein